MTNTRRTRAVACAWLTLSATSWASEISDLMLQTAVDRAVVLEIDGGLEMRGTLVGFDSEHLTVTLDDGRVVALERDRVDGLTLPQLASQGQPTASPPPPALRVTPASAPATALYVAGMK